ncbi:DUF1775 domain-containing protein [Phenylobacterium sp.]|jgi:uncharacterized protein YcnI|uniref:DUF1775 domain-containing protein n=1 Tax=Phenylobacterium sp. TaxID=1871053 RepID=UPI002F95F02D
MDVLKSLALAAALSLVGGTALAHITVWPRQSVQGAREKYVVRIPNERRAPTVRVEATFPAQVKVSAFEDKPGWKVEPRRDASGAIVGAVWTGSLPPDHFAEFGLLAMNPASGSALTWRFVQVYADGTRVEWAGPKGSATPAPQVELQPGSSSAPHH